jgi:hypothetical protein
VDRNGTPTALSQEVKCVKESSRDRSRRRKDNWLFRCPEFVAYRRERELDISGSDSEIVKDGCAMFTGETGALPSNDR